MLVIRLYATDIDYNTVAEAVMPYIAKGLSDKENLFYDILKNVISKDDGKPSGISKLLIKAIPNKNSKVASILQHFDETLTGILNEALQKNNIAANVTALSFRLVEKPKEPEMLKAVITVDDIDYERTVAGLLPLLLQKVSEADGKSGGLGRLIKKNPDLAGDVLLAAIGAIPKQQRNGLLADILWEYRKELTDILNHLIARLHIKAEIRYLKVVCPESEKEKD